MIAFKIVVFSNTSNEKSDKKTANRMIIILGAQNNVFLFISIDNKDKYLKLT